MKRLSRFLLGMGLLVLSSTLLHANDPYQEFSIAKNPNGVWSYGFTETLGGSFILYPTARANFRGSQNRDQWNVGDTTCDDGFAPIVARTPPQQIGSVVYPADTIEMHPGCRGQYTVVRWTAPSTGVFRMQGSFEGIQQAGTTTDVHILLNSVTSLLDSNINDFGAGPLFDVQQQVAAGGTIDFNVGFGSNGNYYGDSTALQLTIDLVPAIDIKIHEAGNKIHIGPSGNVAVAILSSASFNAPAMVVKNSLTFGRIGDEQSLVFRPDRFDSRLLVPVCNTRDVNSDGLKDLVCQFNKQQAGFQFTDTAGVVRGKTGTGVTIKGTESVTIVK